MPGDLQAAHEKSYHPRKRNDPVSFTLNGQNIQGLNGQTLLEAINPHCELPSLCGEKIPDLMTPRPFNAVKAAGDTETACSSCGLCVVEIEGRAELVQACRASLEEGLNVKTFSRAVRRSRLMALKSLASRHKSNCVFCERSGSCRLQKICADQGLALLSQPRPNPEFSLIPAVGKL